MRLAILRSSALFILFIDAALAFQFSNVVAPIRSATRKNKNNIHQKTTRLASTSITGSARTTQQPPQLKPRPNRRQCLTASVTTTAAVLFSFGHIAAAYTPDPDPLCEALYLLCRVQEATCLQERYIDKASPPIQKMKLTLRLVDKSYRLLDQINFISKYMDPDQVVAATQAGNEASESLQDAIDFVYSYPKEKSGAAMTVEEKTFLKNALTNTREKLFDFLEQGLKDKDKLAKARARVEEENKLNVDEFDPDLANDAGIYNPIVLPWKNRSA